MNDKIIITNYLSITMWMIRSGQGGRLVSEALEKGNIAIGWNYIDVSKYKDKSALQETIRTYWPNASKGWIIAATSMLYKFAYIIKKGDKIVTYDSSARIYHVGEVSGEYEFTPNLPDSNDLNASTRKVKWNTKPILRDNLSTSARNSLGSVLTLFELPEFAEKEFDLLLKGKEPIITPEYEEVEQTEYDLESINNKSLEFIKDKLMKLDWKQMQELVAGILRAMGYKTRVSGAGSDRGKDIIASPDGLGFEQPRIIVEVKHRPGSQMGSQEIRSFLGGRHKDDKGLYVSTGGFSKDAHYEAERANIPVTLMDSDGLVESLLDNYDKMDNESRSLLPLSKVYWLV